jgi:hypothetical protein
MKSKLKVGPLPDITTTRLTITVPNTLKMQLDRYAEVYSATFASGTVESSTLIPLMLAIFLQKDRVFQRAIRGEREH